MKGKKHTWSFSMIGGVNRVNIERGDDLLALDQLDQKLWTALSCPVDGLEIDTKTLGWIDADGDGQVRVPEVLAAVKWITGVCKSAEVLLKPEAEFPLAEINVETETGKKLHAAAKDILAALKKSDQIVIGKGDTEDMSKIFQMLPYSGDGVISSNSTADLEMLSLIEIIIDCMGAVKDRGDRVGVTAESIELFYEELQKYVNWHALAEADRKTILPIGEQTEKAFQIYDAVHLKIEDYFVRCRMAAFDPSAAEVLNSITERLVQLNPENLAQRIEDISSYPLSKVAAGRALPLKAGLNPAWELRMQEFVKHVLEPFGFTLEALDEERWNKISQSMAAYQSWMNQKCGHAVEKLGLEKIKELLVGDKKQRLLQVVETDLGYEDEANHVLLVDKLVRLYADVYTLLKNFVTFYDFYSPERQAIFQAGTLYIDQRSCDLCIKVTDLSKHSAMVSVSGIYLLYCDCVSKSRGDRMTIVAALTNGDIDNLVVGRNALFYDRKGQDWDATVIKIVEHPISIRQAFWLPYRRVSRFIEAQVNKVATERESKVEAGTLQNVEQAQATATAPPKKVAEPFDIGKFVGIFAAIGLALGAIGTAIASVVGGFLGLAWWKMPLALCGITLLISGPSMIIAYLKLRKRNLAPILDANGWAINARANVNIQFGNTLTHLAELPFGATVNLNDPFTKKRSKAPGLILLSAALLGGTLYLLWRLGYLHLPV